MAAMDLDEWIDVVCGALGIEDAVDRAVFPDLTLDIARDVAHGIERRAAPITTFLLGVAAGRAADPRTAAVSEAATVASLLRVDQQGVAEGGDRAVE